MGFGKKIIGLTSNTENIVPLTVEVRKKIIGLTSNTENIVPLTVGNYENIAPNITTEKIVGPPTPIKRIKDSFETHFPRIENNIDYCGEILERIFGRPIQQGN